VRWYFCEQGAKPLPFAHCWGNTLYLDLEQKCDSPVGEIPFAPDHRWNNGSTPFGARGQRFCGTQEDFDTPKEWNPSLPSIRRLPSGLSVCCLPELARTLALTARQLPGAGRVTLSSQRVPASGSLSLSSHDLPLGKLVMWSPPVPPAIVLASPSRPEEKVVLNSQLVSLPTGKIVLPNQQRTVGRIGLTSSSLPTGNIVLQSPGIPIGRLVLESPASPYVFDTPGDYTVTVTPGVSFANVHAIGAGGAGAVGYGITFNIGNDGHLGGGGAGGGYAETISLAVSPGDTFTVHVGAGGVGYQGGGNGSGNPGDQSYAIYDPRGDDCTATGGDGGDMSNTLGLGAIGGFPFGSMTTGGFNGGNCPFGPTPSDGSSAPIGGNGGGAGADTLANGGDGNATTSSSGATGGTSALSVGGTGGDWTGSAATNGTDGSPPGAGGGGGGSATGSGTEGQPGKGGNGLVWFEFY